MLSDAFNFMVNFQGREVTLVRLSDPDNIEITAKIAPANYYRNLETVSSTVTPGREFVVSKSAFTETFPSPKRNDRIKDVEMGNMTISEVREMFDIGGAIMGYRLRIS